MKNICLLLLVLCLASCGDDISSELHYDGDNFSAPAIEPGIHEMGARFPSETTNRFNGKTLESVEFFLLTVPERVELIVYGEGNGAEPGPVLYSIDLTGTVSGSTWNTHTLSTPIDVTGEDLWLVIKATHQDNIMSLGCDEGPALTNGDWISSAGNTSFVTLRDRTENEVNINWNIRGNLSK